MSAAANLKKQLGRYKEQLANLSRRNRELFYRESKGTSLSLSKMLMPKSSLHIDCKKTFSGMTFTSNEFANLLSGSDLNLHEFLLLDYYQEKEVAQKISNRLDRIRLADDKYQREFGISGAWVLGPFLCWRTSMNFPKEELLVTPLFKVPVDLYKNKKKQLTLKCEVDSLALNPTFRLAIKQAFGIDFPEDLSFESSKEAIESVTSVLEKAEKKVTALNWDSLPKVPRKFKVVKDESGAIIERIPIKIEDELTAQELEIYKQTTGSEFVLLDLVYLDQLNASRAVLINDYEGIIQNGLEHPILNELFNGACKNFEPPVDRSKLRELDSYREKSNHFVVDIDSTQHRAIDKATKSKAIVIQGPPGSGKSQTIVNLIADYLAKGKKVLFVSEKRPALDVVFNRMKGANIENQSVLIHGSELNKTELYKSFLELASIMPSEDDKKSWHEASDSLDRIKNEINGYADTLQEIHKKSGLKIQELLLLRSTINKNSYVPSVAQQFSQLEFIKLEKFGGYLNEVQELLLKCDDFQKSPWIYKKNSILATADLKYALEKVLSEVSQAVFEIKESVAKVNKFDILKTPVTSETPNIPALPGVGVSVDEIKGIFNQPNLNTETILELKRGLKSCLATVGESRGLCSTVSKDLDLKVAEELVEYYRLPRGPLDWFTSSFWAYRKVRGQFCSAWNGTNSQFKAYLTFSKASGNLKAYYQSISDQLADGTESDLDALIQKCSQQLESMNTFLDFIEDSKKIANPETVRRCLVSATSVAETLGCMREIDQLLNSINTAKDKFSQFENSLSQYLTSIPKPVNPQSFEIWVQSLIERLSDLKIFDEVDLAISKAEVQIGEVDLRNKIVNHFFSLKGSWAETLLSSTLQLWYDEAVQSFPNLRSFERGKIDLAYQEFLKAVENHKINSRLALTQVFATSWSSSNADKSGLGILAKESAKQRRVLSPREIMEKGALKTMLQLKSCWLMSPLSISQILPLEAGLFDVIIFDEASQVRVEDAIPSIYRASTMIVVGDDKQMPPTVFFSGSCPDDDDDEEEAIAQSVLDLASQVYPSVLLEWHYRSRSEALIAFSNRAFYGGRLIAAPNPQTLTSSGTIKLHRVESGYFNSKDGNPTEADAVIANLIEQIKENPKQSYGIIAMGVSQASALQDALEKRMNSDGKVSELIEKAMQYKEGDADAGLFIKNLENVQGDERDIIILSVGYAPPSAGKNLRLGFGPLSMKGGGRRLNVAVTRAKHKMHVFCSFNPSEILTGEDIFSKNPDVCYFGRYLKFAEAVSNGKEEIAKGILDTFPMSGIITSRKGSRFSMDVKRRLEELGYEVSSEIGTSGFYIDLAIHHPILKSNFLVGIECDGAIFHSTPYARDRDKIRQNLLESRGWKILRVWSQDWSNDWSREILRLDLAIKGIQQEPAAFQSKKAS